ncbi:MAG: M28 family peptidase [Planctomycetes bacterium]|nr:M28 family peptidase [Planctomycetota bacterium]
MTSRSKSRSLDSRALLVATLLATVPACGGPSGPIEGARAHGHLQHMVEIGPRPFGSDNLARTADYICAEIEKLGLKPERQEQLHEKEKKTIRNLFTRIDGPDPDNGPILMIGAHYDTKVTEGCAEWTHSGPFLGAIDGGGGPAVLLELARAIKAVQGELATNVWLYWIDAEESIDWTWNDDRALLGSKAFCEWLHQQKLLKRLKAFVLLDLIGDKNIKIDRDGNSSEHLLSLFADAATAIGERDRLFEFPTQNEIDTLKQRGIKWGTKDDHNIFTNFGVPSVLLIDFARRIGGDGQPQDDRYARWWHTPDDNLEQVSADSLAIVGNLVMQALPQLQDFCLGKRK